MNGLCSAMLFLVEEREGGLRFQVPLLPTEDINNDENILNLNDLHIN